MLDFLRNTGGASERKLRLFTVACFPWVAEASAADPRRTVIEVLERVADGRATAEELLKAREALTSLDWDLDSATRLPAWEATRAAVHDSALSESHGVYYRTLDRLRDSTRKEALAQAEAAAGAAADLVAIRQASLLRDLFGPFPFRPVTFHSAWRTEEVKRIAELIYERRRFGDLPLLAHAL